MSVDRTVSLLCQNPRGKRGIFFFTLAIICILFVFICVAKTESLALQAYSLLLVFDLLCIVTSLVNVYCEETKKPDRHSFSYGDARHDVLGVFSCTILAMLGALFVAKESLEHMLQHSEDSDDASHHSPTWLLLSASVAFAAHILLYNAEASHNTALNVVMNGSSSSWIQEHCADMSHTLCRFVPGLSRFLLPRVNALSFLNVSGWFLSALSFVLQESSQCYMCDGFLALFMVFTILGSMKPLAIYTGRILLQTSPSHTLPQLDKCLREAATLDGVLEITDDHFWQLSLGRMAGSVVVRVRRDADEQLVLSHVTAKLYPIVSDLSVQVNKDSSWRPVLLN